jgi:hypothetical protein
MDEMKSEIYAIPAKAWRMNGKARQPGRHCQPALLLAATTPLFSALMTRMCRARMFLNPSYNYLHNDKSRVDLTQLSARSAGIRGTNTQHESGGFCGRVDL